MIKYMYKHTVNGKEEKKEANNVRLAAGSIIQPPNDLNVGRKVRLNFKNDSTYGFTFRRSKGQKSQHIVTSVALESVAHQEGIKVNDIILRVNNEPVSSLTHNQVLKKIFTLRSEEQVAIRVPYQSKEMS